MKREDAIAVLNMVEAHGSLAIEAKDMAIKALEQEGYYKDLAQSYERTIVKLTEAVAERQPSEDCVSRQAVLERIDDWWGITSTSGEPTLCDCIQELPPVTPTQKWISVSERLPEKNGKYLAYIINKKDTNLQYIMTCEYYEGDLWNWFPDDDCASDNVVAWMPLPEPYKAEMEGEE